jgi:hypothetical protein
VVGTVVSVEGGVVGGAAVVAGAVVGAAGSFAGAPAAARTVEDSWTRSATTATPFNERTIVEWRSGWGIRPSSLSTTSA